MITDQFIFIHIPKTGGTFIRQLIKTKQWNKVVDDIHLTISQSEEHVKSVPSFCFVRNPWDWYVSRFFYRQKILERSGNAFGFIPLELTGNSKKGFKKHIILLNELIVEGKKTNSPCRALRMITVQEFFNKFTENRVNFIGKFENFRQDLIRILTSISPKKFDSNYIRQKTTTKENESIHLPYQKYYDNEILDIVYKWDLEYINRFNYSFGEST